jgi:hypothetical protein
MLYPAFWQEFTDVSGVFGASIMRAFIAFMMEAIGTF